MWCPDCQQDVPAVAPPAGDSLVCSRCQAELLAVATAPSEAGIALDSFDQQPCAESDPLTPPRDWIDRDDTQKRLREIDRVLNSPYRRQGLLPQPQRTWSDLPAPPATVEPRAARNRPQPAPAATKKSWLLSFLLFSGAVGFCIGLGVLAWSAAFQLPQHWQHGMTLTIGAEGLLILSLAWMAARLWRNGRHMNQQLDGVDRQLTEMQHITGTLAGSQTASSQHFYHHFSQTANPHLLVANLRGQVEQLAGRVGT